MILRLRSLTLLSILSRISILTILLRSLHVSSLHRTRLQNLNITSKKKDLFIGDTF
ncbi:hypothetical protein Lalb_Chr21g0309721 [Lupinus albus]|uniref:Uncharacterized protein n=1 Tax=Lupinus albus TaxID=3870 RepID=A0A6A4N5M7_LUPAL|nr:hypothetical protein Lalb_Chr21g0309721 [Lupinus albus]